MQAVVKYIGEHIEHVPGRKDDDPGRRQAPSFTAEQARSFRGILRFLNDKDRDILYLIFVSGKKQKDVLKILGRTQSSLAYDIKRIRRRLEFISHLNKVSDIFMNFIRERKECFTPEEIEILTLMFFTSSFTLTSEILGVSQVRVRYAYNKCLRSMEEKGMAADELEKWDEEAKKWWEIYEIFMMIRSNLNIVRRVYKATGRDVCLLV